MQAEIHSPDYFFDKFLSQHAGVQRNVNLLKASYCLVGKPFHFGAFEEGGQELKEVQLT